MSRKKIDLILEESLERRERGLKEYQSFGHESERIAAKIAALDEQIEHLLDKREKLKDKWGEAHNRYERDLRKINSSVEINKWLLQNKEVEIGRTGINSDDALLLANLLSSSAEDTLRLAEDDRNKISSIMERLDEQLIESRGGLRSFRLDISIPNGNDCTGSKGGCKESCTFSCKNSCIASCKDNCLGSCKYSCTSTCTGMCFQDCMAACAPNCMATCLGSCLGGCTGSVKAHK